MGVNNQARRAAKRRKRAKTGHGPTPGSAGFGPSGPGPSRYGSGGFGPSGPGPSDAFDALDEATFVYDLVRSALEDVRADAGLAKARARDLIDNGGPARARIAARAVDQWLADAVSAVVRGGWTPSDLGEIVRRRLSAGHLPVLAAALAREVARHRADRVSPRWREDLEGLGQGTATNSRTTEGLALTLGLTAALSMLPRVTEVLPPPGSAQAGRDPRLSGEDGKQLSRVRALLAKAESTEYDEEAEALSAKAQELISRYALTRLLHRSEEAASDSSAVARRLWIDPPYVVAKAHLVDAVASANRCRTVLSEGLGFSTVVGEAIDIDSVELLVTSLLVQASTAMQRYGRQIDHRGTSRTRSFRQSFLTAYASRIAERLQAANVHATEETGHADALLPVLRQQAQHVEDAYRTLFPDLVVKETTISNGHGWAAGRAAADLALLDPHGKVTADAR